MIYLTLAIDEAEFNKQMQSLVVETDDTSEWPLSATAHGVVRDYGFPVGLLEKR